jgi:hypothetical protein
MRLGPQRSFGRRWPIACVLSLPLLAIASAIASAAHSKARSVEPIDASFQVGDSGTIEASLDPPIEGVLRIIVQARESAGGHSLQSDRQPPTLEVTQWDRPIPFRLVSQSGRHNPFAGRPALLVADIDVNDLTPGVPVRVRVHSNLPDSPNSAPPELEGHAFAIVY